MSGGVGVGHNGCLDCMTEVQAYQAECPLCRSSFDKDLRLSLNTQLRDLVDDATRLHVDEGDRANGWEAFPTAQMTTKHYSMEMMHKSEGECSAQPSAPPSVEWMSMDVASIDPPMWIPDSISGTCMGCQKPFLPLIRFRHHCRLCGRLFCNACSSERHFLPPKFNERDPQRVCDACACVLSLMVGPHNEAEKRVDRVPVHDSFDWCSVRSWLNIPYSNDMEQDIYKATNIVRTFHQLATSFPGAVPTEILNSAKGVAILAEVKVAFGVWSYRVGTGLVLSRLDGTWSPPCAISSASVGAGLQIGGQLMDVFILLPDQESIEAFTGNVQIGISGGASATFGVGPGFRTVLSLKMNRGDGARVAKGHCFCLCRGAFVGASLDGTLISVRKQINHAFYNSIVSPKHLLLKPPPTHLRSTMHLNRELDALFDGRANLSLPCDRSEKCPAICIE